MKKEIFLIHSLESKYCLVVLFLSLFLGYYLVPSSVIHSSFGILAFLFVFLFALTLMCMIRNIKERLLIARTYKSSLLSLLATSLGLITLQACGIGAPVCGTMMGMGLLSFLFPISFYSLPLRYIIFLFILSIVLQLISLYFMNCFKPVRKK